MVPFLTKSRVMGHVFVITHHTQGHQLAAVGWSIRIESDNQRRKKPLHRQKTLTGEDSGDASGVSCLRVLPCADYPVPRAPTPAWTVASSLVAFCIIRV